MTQIESINPSNYESLGSVPVSSLPEIERAVAKAHTAQKEWSALSITERVAALRTLAQAFVTQKEQLAFMQSQEVGMPIGESLDDIDGTAQFITAYLDNAEKLLAPQVTDQTDNETLTVFREPYGVQASIIPWNFPFNNFAWNAVQSLIAGNAIILKHSEECPISGQQISELVNACNIPKGLFTVVTGDGAIGKQLIEQDVDIIGFTGSSATGRSIYKSASERMIRLYMELGGSAPAIVFPDADIAKSVESIAQFRLWDQGQVCDGLKRAIVHESVFEDVVARLTEIFSNKNIGDATNSNTEVGPLVAARQVQRLEQQVDEAIQKSAKPTTGGGSLEQELGGAYFSPTVLTNITTDMAVWRQEVFGPVLPVISYKTDEEAIALANDTDYGLGAYLFSSNIENATRAARNINTGMVSINGTNYVGPNSPFGGTKKSGIGREHGRFGFEEVTYPKVISTPR